MNIILNKGTKRSEITSTSGELQQSKGIYIFDVRTTITVETKKILTPQERMRKNLIIAFLASLVLMIGLSTIGSWLPDAQARLGREMMLVSEVPAFASSLFATRIFLKKKKKVDGSTAPIK